MHDFTMPQWAIARVMQRRGKLHVFDDMVPRKTALVVVDLQNGFMVPEHTATLASFYSVFGDVMDTETVIACLRKNAACYAEAAE